MVTINNIRAFVGITMDDFLKAHPEIKSQFENFLGNRILMIQKGVADERYFYSDHIVCPCGHYWECPGSNGQCDKHTICPACKREIW